jgi:Putative inner membrane protein (DUF1819)
MYDTEISRGSLMPLESKRIALLLLTQPDKAAWTMAIRVENILQKDTVTTASRQAKLIRKRLETLDAEAWQLITERDSEVTNQLLFAGAIKDSKILGDFMCNVYATCQRRMESSITPANWEDFLTECTHQDPTVADWNEYTQSKVLNGIVRILVESKYLVDRKTMRISPRSLHPVVRRYLYDHNENYVLDCLDRSK